MGLSDGGMGQDARHRCRLYFVGVSLPVHHQCADVHTLEGHFVAILIINYLRSQCWVEGEILVRWRYILDDLPILTV